MGLKDLKSKLDSPTLGIEGDIVANSVPSTGFNTLNGTSNSPFSSGDHMVDLLTKNVTSTQTGETYKNSPNKAPYQDLDGIQGPESQLSTDLASQKHIDSLQVVPGGDSNSPYQDLDGVQGPQFQRELTIASQVHESSLSLVPNQSSYQDLDGLPNNPSFADGGGGSKKLSGKDLHESLLTENYQYSHSTPQVTINAGSKDLDGGLPSNGEYINNFPS